MCIRDSTRDVEWTSSDDKIATVSTNGAVSYTHLDVYKRQTYQDASDFTWETSDDSVATVKDGVVTGLSHGTAIITATSHNGLHDSCLVRVIVPTDEITITLIG